MAKLEEATGPRVNLGRGFRRILLVVVALYWLVAAADVTRAYRDAATKVDQSTLAYIALADGRVVVMKPNDPITGFNPSLCREALPDIRVQLAAKYPGMRIKEDACTVEGIEHAKAHIRFLEGRDALESELLGWSIAFVILAVISLVTRWVWHGFVGKRPPRQRVSPP
jgi:hypothetical protein